MVFGRRTPPANPAGPGLAVDPWLGFVERTRRGEPAAARALIEGVAPAVAGVVRRMLGPSHPEAEDLIQESLLGFVRSLDAFRGQSSVLHYARRVTLFRVLEEQKKKLSQKRLVDNDALQEDAQLRMYAPRTEAEVLAARQRIRLRELLAVLRPEQAEVLALRHVLDYTVEEIAEATGVPPNTVRSRLRLAKEALRTRIEGDPLLCELDVRQA